MRLRGRGRCVAVVGAVVIGVASWCHGQVVITEIMHSPGGTDALWEWIEIMNITASPIDLDNWVFDDDDDSSLSVANISSAGGTRNTVVPAGGVAVLYAGDELDFMPERFHAAWGSGITLIAVDGLTTLTSSDAIGLWSSHASYLADAIPGATTSPRRTFANAVAAIDYSTGFPTAASGRSIAWNGGGSVSSGAHWVQSEDGILGAWTSVETTREGAQINSTNDTGNPGVLPSGSAAAGLIITEIMFAPDSPLVTGGSYTSTDFEWIEVLNNSSLAIDFAVTPYVFDDIAGSQLATANVSTGTLAAGGVGVLFNGARISIEDMQAMWGAGNYIPVANWPSLNNQGGDTIAIWDSLEDYNNEPVTGAGRTHENAVAAVTYNTVAGEGWPTISTGRSIWLNNLNGDPNVGQHWTRAGASGDSLSRSAAPIFQTVVDHPGGDVGSPGYVPGTIVGLPGDHNGDGRVNAADYVLWRKTGVGGEQGYNQWRSNFGAVAGAGATAIAETAVPEPTSTWLLLYGVVLGLRRCVGRVLRDQR